MGKLVFGVVSIIVILFGLVVLMFLIWLVSILVFEVVVGFLWCMMEYIMFVGDRVLLLWKVIFLCSVSI